MEPVEPVQMNIYQSNTYRKDLSWPHFDDEPRVQEKQQVKDQQSCISVFVLHLQKLSEISISKGCGGELGVKNCFRGKCFHVK